MKQFLLILTCIVIIQGMCLAGPVVALVDNNMISCLENGPDKKKPKEASTEDADEQSEEELEDEFEEEGDDDGWGDESDEEVEEESQD